MIKAGNTHFNPKELEGVSFEDFKAMYRGKVNADLLSVWTEIQEHNKLFCKEVIRFPKGMTESHPEIIEALGLKKVEDVRAITKPVKKSAKTKS